MGNNCCGSNKSKKDKILIKEKSLGSPKNKNKFNKVLNDLNLMPMTNFNTTTTFNNNNNNNNNNDNCSPKDNVKVNLDEKIKDTVVTASVSKEPNNRSNISSAIILKYLGQDINLIRAKNKPFEDFYFLKTISSICETTDSNLFLSIRSRLGCSSDTGLKELNKLVKWQRTKVVLDIFIFEIDLLFYKDLIKNLSGENKANEFVLNEEGVALNKPLSRADYANFFSFSDIFQGWNGNCYHVATMMALTKNEELLEFVVPPENASRHNINMGAFNFRFWHVGSWYDVVIDDYLPTNGQNELIFSHNNIYINEYWVPLFEKAFAKFLGNYDELEGTVFEDSALYLSGGLHEEYKIEQIKNDSKENDSCPSMNELLKIIKIALIKRDIVGCILEDEDLAQKYGIHKEHFYLISDIFNNENITYVRIHNPFNTPENIKNCNEYQQLETKLCNLGLTPTTHGEVWMTSESFIKCFKKLKLFNLQPEKKIHQNVYPKNMPYLKNKTNILTTWKCKLFKGTFPAKARKIEWDSNLYKKFIINVKSIAGKDIIFSLVQDRIRKRCINKQAQKLSLRIFKFINKDWGLFKTVTYQDSLQWCMRMAIDPGMYLFIYEPCFELTNDLNYCFRVFSDETDHLNETTQDWLIIKVFDDQPSFRPSK